MADVIENGYAKAEHVLAATPPTLDEVDAKLDAFIARSDAFMERIGLVLDGFEDFANGPMGKLMLRKAGKGTE